MVSFHCAVTGFIEAPYTAKNGILSITGILFFITEHEFWAELKLKPFGFSWPNIPDEAQLGPQKYKWFLQSLEGDPPCVLKANIQLQEPLACCL